MTRDIILGSVRPMCSSTTWMIETEWTTSISLLGGMDMEKTENEIIGRLDQEVRSEMIARLEQEVREIEPDEFIWADPGPVSLEQALEELGFDWNELENIAQDHVHLGIPIREYPKTDLVYLRAQELQNARERKEKEEEVLTHHLHSWVVEARAEKDIWDEKDAIWVGIRHVPDPVCYDLHEKEWREFVADVERAIASPGERFLGGRHKRLQEESDQDSDGSGGWS